LDIKISDRRRRRRAFSQR
jgi:hypothetical protein